MLSLFSIFKINYLNYIINNLLVAVLIILVAIYLLISKERRAKPSIINFLLSTVFTKLNAQTVEILGENKRGYTSFVNTVFFVILFFNIIGIFPFLFSLSSMIVVTMCLSLSVITGVTVFGVCKHKFNYFNRFAPFGCPEKLAPVLVIIEISSHFIRIISLGVRLVANITAGHLLMVLIISFFFKGAESVKYLQLPHWYCKLPLVILFSIFYPLLLFLIILLEIIIAIVQAYIFAILLTVYLSE